MKRIALLSVFVLLVIMACGEDKPRSPLAPLLAPAANVGINMDQCQNISLAHFTDPCGTAPTNQHPSWANGDVNVNNSQYREGDGLPYRNALTGITNGIWVVRVDYDFTQAGVFAVDRLTRFDLTQASNPCLSTNQVTCTVSAGFFEFDMPSEVAAPSADQPALPNSGDLDIAGTAANLAAADKKMRVWVTGGTGVFVSAGQNTGINDNFVKQNGLASGNSDREFAFKFTLSGCPANGCNVMMGWTGHIASAVDWGPGKGAASISGAPFHMRIKGVDQAQGTSGGNQDRSVQLGAIVQTIEVRKVLDPSTDPGLFNLQVDGTTVGTGANVGNGGTTGPVSVTAASHNVGETGGTGTSLGNYTTVISCVDASGTVVASGGGTPLSVPVVVGAAIVCTITNTRTPHLTVTKVLIPSNDGGKFNLQIDGVTAGTGTNVGDGGTTGAVAVTVGKHTAGEAAGIGTTLGDYSTVIGGDCAADGTITLASGDNKTCTITNTFRTPHLTVVKTVTNNNGGNAQPNDFKPSVGGTVVQSGVKNSYAANTALAIDETQLTGYTFVSITGDAKCPAVLGGTITLDEGDDITCTITNDDATAHLNLVKVVTADNGGTAVATDFTLSAAGPTPISGAGGAESDVNAGSYALSETGPSGYLASAWVCVGGTQNGSNVTLANGVSATCTINNDDIQPKLTVIKIVQGGVGVLPSDFTITVTGNSPSPATFPGSAGQLVTLNAGDYSVTESTVSPYTGGFSADCTGSIAVGETKTCTITNSVATRSSQGFWATHFTVASSTWLAIPTDDRNWCSGAKNMSNGPATADVAEMEGGFWSSISKKTLSPFNRSAIDQARMQLVQQLLAAMLNKQAFGAPDGGLIAAGVAAYCTGPTASILSSAGALEQYNTSGETVPFPSGFNPGSAAPKTAQANANKAFWDVLP